MEPIIRLNYIVYFELCFHDTKVDLFLSTNVEPDYRHSSKLATPLETPLPAIRQLKLLYIKNSQIHYLNQVTSVCQSRILLLIVNIILAIAHREDHLGFSRCFEIFS